MPKPNAPVVCGKTEKTSNSASKVLMMDQVELLIDRTRGLPMKTVLK